MFHMTKAKDQNETKNQCVVGFLRQIIGFVFYLLNEYENDNVKNYKYFVSFLHLLTDESNNENHKIRWYGSLTMQIEPTIQMRQ